VVVSGTGDNPVDLFNRTPQSGGLVKHPPVPMTFAPNGSAPLVLEESGGWSDVGLARRTAPAPGFSRGYLTHTSP